jgi:hypothetical protein
LTLLIESNRPLRVRLSDGDLRLIPGRPIEVPDETASRLLMKAGDKVRAVTPRPTPDWLTAWRELAAMTNGITRDDPRFQPVLEALNRCDDAYLAGDWPAFRLGAEEVRGTAMERQ